MSERQIKVHGQKPVYKIVNNWNVNYILNLLIKLPYLHKLY